MPSPSGVLATGFAGQRTRLLGLALRTSLLTLLTLGIYRFWMKTRLRRYYWSSVRPGDAPLEYMGEPLEKLLGFLIAVVFLAFYIGIVNLILMFASFAIFNGNIFAYAVSFVGLIPIVFFARYRARRYLLGRTRWRGVRFALGQGAWGYAWRAMAHWLLTLLSLGLLWPRMTFYLEKYCADRTRFGSAQIVQGGRWTMLFPQLRHVGIGLAISALSFGLSYAVFPPASSGFVVGLVWMLYGVVYYNVQSFRLLTNHKTAQGIGFIANPRPGRVFGIYAFGGLLLCVLTVLPLVVFGVVIFVLADAQSAANFGQMWQRISGVLPAWAGIGLSTLIYFATFLLWGILKQVLITLPRLRHYAETLQITGAEGLAKVNQRGHFDFAEAEGFAEALDVGAAI